MKKNTILILSITFCILIIGASVLYNQLKDEVKRESLITSENEKITSDKSNSTENTANETTSNHTESNTSSDSESAEEPYTAPDFTVTDIDGNEIHLSDYLGKPVIVNFWASWCGPCKSEMPAFEDAYTEYKDEIQFMIVNMTDGSRETVDTAASYIEEQGYTFPVFYDTQSIAAYTYQVYSIPATYFINADGHLIAAAQSAIDRDTLQKGIDMIYTK